MTTATRLVAVLLIFALAACAERAEPPTIVEGTLGARYFDTPHAIYSISEGLLWDDESITILISNDRDACSKLTSPGWFARSVVSNGYGGTQPSLALQMERNSSFESDERIVGAEARPLRASFDPGSEDKNLMEWIEACGGSANINHSDDPGSDARAFGSFAVSFGERGDARGTFNAEYCEALDGGGCSAAGGGFAIGAVPLVLLALRRRRTR